MLFLIALSVEVVPFLGSTEVHPDEKLAKVKEYCAVSLTIVGKASSHDSNRIVDHGTSAEQSSYHLL